MNPTHVDFGCNWYNFSGQVVRKLSSTGSGQIIQKSDEATYLVDIKRCIVKIEFNNETHKSLNDDKKELLVPPITYARIAKEKQYRSHFICLVKSLRNLLLDTDQWKEQLLIWSP